MVGTIIDVIKKIRELALSVLPSNSRVLLYGSRARGDYFEESDWDLLIILDKQTATRDDFNKYAYPFHVLGAEMQELFSPIIYGRKQWSDMQVSDFYQNIINDNITIL